MMLISEWKLLPYVMLLGVMMLGGCNATRNEAYSYQYGYDANAVKEMPQAIGMPGHLQVTEH